MTASHENNGSNLNQDSNSTVGRWLYWDEPVIKTAGNQLNEVSQIKHDEELLERLYLEYVVEFNNLDLRDRSPENSERIFKNKVRYYASQLQC